MLTRLRCFQQSLQYKASTKAETNVRTQLRASDYCRSVVRTKHTSEVTDLCIHGTLLPGDFLAHSSTAMPWLCKAVGG
jgi:hypothetical protein